MAVRSKALIDAKFESKRNAEEARRAVLVKAILEAKEQAAAFTIDVADIFDTYRYIKKQDEQVADPFWRDICQGCHEYGIDFANAYPVDGEVKRTWVFTSNDSGNAELVVTRNTVVIRHYKNLYHDLDIDTLTTSEAERLLTDITKFNEGFPKYVEHFFKMVDNINL